MRLAMLGLYHEANTFSPILADRELFAAGGVLRGREIVDEYASSATTLGGYLAAGEKLGVEVVPLVFAFVNPIGAITEDAFEALVDEMIGQLAGHGPWDGVLLNLHGAAVAEHVPDADAEIASRVRRVVGPAAPVGAVLDLHANVSQRLVDALTVTLVYQTNPHVDAAQQAMRCAELVVQAARGEIEPKQWLIRLPLVANIARQDTSEEPMATLVAAAAQVASRPGMLSASVVEGFPYADVPQMGMSCLVIHDGDQFEAKRAAQSLAAVVWTCRADLQAQGLSVDAALDLVEREPAGPVVLLDVGDNIGGGAPGDSTVILAAAMRRRIRSLVQTLWDASAVRACAEAGVGAEVELSVGARHEHSAGSPVRVTGRVRLLSDGRFEDPAATHGGFRFYDMGPTAVLETAGGHTLALTSRQIMNTSRQQLLSLGIDPARYRVVVAKGVNGPRAAYGPIAARMLVVDTDGITAMGLDRFDYTRRPRPLYPFEPAAVLGPT
jgi:microcystin degradation protein MlrC